MNTIVIADTVKRAESIGQSLPLAGRAIGASPRSIKLGACRGYVEVTLIVVDDSAWPLTEAAEEVLSPYLAWGARIVHLLAL